MSAWSTAIEFVLKWEAGGDPHGGYTSDPDDPGGATRWGISKRAHPDVDVETLTREQAQALYFEAYWKPIRGADLPEPVAVALFDFAVHSGVRTAVMRLQRIVGAVLDGVMGDRTLKAVAGRPPLQLALELTLARARHQGSLIVATPSLARFAGGWAARCVDLTATFSRL